MQLGGAAGMAGGPISLVSLAGTSTEVRLNFAIAAIANYNMIYIDPNDSTRAQYEVRWAVHTVFSGPTIVSKRFFVGVQKRAPQNTLGPVTVEAWVQR